MRSLVQDVLPTFSHSASPSGHPSVAARAARAVPTKRSGAWSRGCAQAKATGAFSFGQVRHGYGIDRAGRSAPTRQLLDLLRRMREVDSRREVDSHHASGREPAGLAARTAGAGGSRLLRFGRGLRLDLRQAVGRGSRVAGVLGFRNCCRRYPVDAQSSQSAYERGRLERSEMDLGGRRRRRREHGFGLGSATAAGQPAVTTCQVPPKPLIP